MGKTLFWPIYHSLPRINDVNYLVRKGPSVPAFITHVDKLKKYVCDVPDARVSVICRKMRYYCPSCDYETRNGRSMRRQAIGHHNSEWRGLGRPLWPIPSKRLPQARETLRLLQMNSRQRRREADRRRSGVPLVVTMRAASVPRDDSDDPGSSAGDGHPMRATTRVRPAGISDPDDLSDVELPELSVGRSKTSTSTLCRGWIRDRLRPCSRRSTTWTLLSGSMRRPHTRRLGRRRTGPYGPALLAGSQPQRLPHGYARIRGSRRPLSLTGWHRDRPIPANSRFYAGRRMSWWKSKESPLSAMCSGPRAPGPTRGTTESSIADCGKLFRRPAVDRARTRAATRRARVHIRSASLRLLSSPTGYQPWFCRDQL